MQNSPWSLTFHQEKRKDVEHANRWGSASKGHRASQKSSLLTLHCPSFDVGRTAFPLQEQRCWYFTKDHLSSQGRARLRGLVPNHVGYWSSAIFILLPKVLIRKSTQHCPFVFFIILCPCRYHVYVQIAYDPAPLLENVHGWIHQDSSHFFQIIEQSTKTTSLRSGNVNTHSLPSSHPLKEICLFIGDSQIPMYLCHS